MNRGALMQQGTTGVTCPWCKQYLASMPPSGDCHKCGGPLPAPPGETGGPQPPPSPRHIPDQYKKDLLFSKNVGAFVGLAFAIVGVVVAVIGIGLVCVVPIVGLGLLLFGAVFGGIGLTLRSSARGAAMRKLEALMHGEVAEGKIVSVGPDMTESVNGRHPTRIDYVFTADGRLTSGATNGWDAVNMVRQPGEPLWVVFMANDPTANSIWPPIA
jgi:hypothetical protein